jgi:hypothetical protein
METEEFKKLRQLLSLKRHESPPPGYFNNFSDKVLAQIQSRTERRPLTWWQRLFGNLDLKPVMVGAYGVAIAAVLLFGLNVATKVGRQPQSGAATGGPSLTGSPNLPGNLAVQPVTTPLNSATGTMVIASTSQPPAILLNPTAQVEKASFKK